MERYDLEKHGVTQTLLSMFLTCEYSAELYLRSVTSTSISSSIMFGSVVHSVIEAMRKRAVKHGGSLAKMSRSVRTSVLKKVAFTALGRERERYVPTGTKSQELVTMFGIIKHMIPYYLQSHDSGKRVIDQDFKERKWVAAEKTFNVMWRGFRLRGKLDGAFLPKSNSFWLVETKAKGQIEQNYGRLLPLNFQNLFYTTAGEEMYKKKVSGMLYDVFRIPGHKTFDSFKAAIIKDPKHFFLRYPISITSSRKKEFNRVLENVLHKFAGWVERVIETRSEPADRNFALCGSTKYTCDYLPLCAENRKAFYTVRDVMFPELVA